MRILFVLLVLANLALFAASQGYFGPPPAERGRDPERLLMELHPETIHVPNDREHQADVNAPTPTPSAPPNPGAQAMPDTEPAAAEPAASTVTPATPESVAPEAATSAAPLPPAVAQEALPAPTPAAAVLPAPSPVPAAPPAAPPTASVETVCREWGSFTEAEAKRARQWVQKQWSGVTVQSVTEAGPASWMVLVPPAANLAAAQKTAAALGKQGIKDLFVIQDAGPNQYAISLGVFSQEKSARALAQSLQTKAGRSLQVVPRPGPTRHWLQFSTLEASQQATLRQQAIKQFNREWRVCKG